MTESDRITMKETRTLAEFQSKDEYIEAMVEDLSDWLNFLYNLQGEYQLTSENFFRHLKNGVILCKHARVVQSFAEIYLNTFHCHGRQLPMKIGNQTLQVPLQPPKYTVVDFTKTIFLYHERDNVSNFISWCRKLNIPTSLTFETEDLVSMKNQRSVVIALLELSRVGKLFGMEVPDIIQLEQEIDDEINRTANGDMNTDGMVDSNCNNLVDLDQDSDALNNNSSYNEVESSVMLDDTDYNSTNTVQQYNNSCLDNSNVKQSRGKHRSFGFNGRRYSANISRHDILPLVDSRPTSSIGDNNENQSLKVPSPLGKIRKSQSICFQAEESTDVTRNDNSDNESNFSQTSHTNFVIPKYKTARPVGRVKIYDNFDRCNYVKEKKTREKVDLRSLDERVRDILSQCQCDETFPMKRIGEGRYQWGDQKGVIFVRILRTHVMVRVGGGWNTLSDFLNKHDSCRKDKCERFKFYLPALNKKSSPTVDETKSILQPSVTRPDNQLNFSQGMITVQKSVNVDSVDSGVASEVCVSVNNRTVNKDNTETVNTVNKENVNEPMKASGAALPVSVTPIRIKQTAKHIPVPVTSKSAYANKNNDVTLRNRPFNSRSQSQHESLHTTNSPDTLRFNLEELLSERSPRPNSFAMLSNGTSKIPTFRFQNKK